MKYDTDSQLLRAAANSIEMQKAAGLEPKFKVSGDVLYLNISNLYSIAVDIEFPRTILEGKQVWIGDVAYFDGEKRIAREGGWYDDVDSHRESFGNEALCNYTWTLPTPTIPEGFTPWHGGKWTGHPLDRVDYVLLDKQIYKDTLAYLLHWERRNHILDVKGYRIVKKHEEPETVMMELPINMARYYAELQNQDISVMREACREALEKAGEK